MKEERKDYSKDILTELELSFGGISHVVLTESEQNIYLLVDKKRADPAPAGRVEIKDIVRFREVLVGFLSMVQRGLRYQPDGKEKKAQREYERLVNQSRSGVLGIGYYQELYRIMSEVDVDAFAGIDPLLTIREGAFYIEAFDKRGQRHIQLSLDEHFWEVITPLVDGTAHINITESFIAQLGAIKPNTPLYLQVGKDAGDEACSRRWKGTLRKNFSIELEWLRSVLFLQAAAA